MIFIKENASENAVCKMAAILSQRQSVQYILQVMTSLENQFYCQKYFIKFWN